MRLRDLKLGQRFTWVLMEVRLKSVYDQFAMGPMAYTGQVFTIVERSSFGGIIATAVKEGGLWEFHDDWEVGRGELDDLAELVKECEPK